MNNKKLNTALQFLIIGLILVVLNLLSASIFKRIDLTDDNRHTVSEVSKEYLGKLDRNVFMTVYYGGELPTHYKQFEEGMATFLEELRLHSRGRFDYQFVDPGSDPAIFQRFAQKQLYPFRVTVPTSSTAQKEVQVLPYAQINYNQKDVMINLIHNCIYMTQEGQPDFLINCALQRFEYNVLTTIYNMSREKFKTIGLLTGHGEYPKEAMSDLFQDIDHYYNIIKADLRNGKAIGPSNLDLLLVLQPKIALSEREKYEIDQYIMRGGKVIFTLDHEILDFTIGEQASTLTGLRETQLDDLLMKYGLKVNYNLVKDANCGMINTSSYSAAFGNETRKAYWPYFPVIRNLSAHPATRYLSRLLIRYGASIDTFNVEGINKTVLFKSSKATWLKDGRQYINIDQEIQQRPDLRQYVNGSQIMGLLLEGSFNSLFAGRSVPVDSVAVNPPNEAFISVSLPGTNARVVVISDGEFATGDQAGGMVARLPEENKQLMINLIDIMTGQELLTKLRIRQFHDRMLDPQKVMGNETVIRIVNIGLPVIAIVVFGLIRGYFRRRKNQALQQGS